MRSRFLISLLATALATLAVLGGIGFAVTKLWVKPPRDKFLTSYFEFELAPQWRCNRDGTEYVCQPGPPPTNAIIIMAMKPRNDRDNLTAYEAHLQSSQKVTSRQDGKETMSEVRFVRRRKLGSQEWVESLHVGSEIPNYLTYYMGTNTANLGILVTMSVHRDHADKYVRQLQEMMETLHVYQR
jgi:hypothetical protein